MTTQQRLDICPNWCTTGPDCQGEHYGPTVYVPATAGNPQLDPQLGPAYPTVGVGLYLNSRDDVEPAVSLHLTGAGLDLDVDLRPGEARQLLEQLGQVVATLGQD